MKHLIIDSEQEVILRQTLAGVSSFLSARASRRDPMGLITKAYKLQERKTANLAFQLDQPPIAAWLDIPLDHKGAFLALLRAMLDAKSDHYREVAYTQILAFITAHRSARTMPSRLPAETPKEISQ